MIKGEDRERESTSRVSQVEKCKCSVKTNGENDEKEGAGDGK